VSSRKAGGKRPGGAGDEEQSVESNQKAPGSPGEHRSGYAILLLLLVGLLAGCQNADQRMQSSQRAGRPARPRTLTVGKSVEGRPLECLVFGHGPDGVLIFSTIHGSEPAGTALVQRLAENLSQQPDLMNGRQVVLMPVANPDGMARRQRHNAHGVDVNRNFPASNFESGSSMGTSALSEPESVALYRVISAFRPRRIVSLHQPMNEGNACIDYDGPAETLARAMGAECDLPVKRLGTRSGSLGSYAGFLLGIPIVTVELPKTADQWSPEVLWDRYGRMLLAAIEFSESRAKRAGPARK
jgi:murein peptide amidase A